MTARRTRAGPSGCVRPCSQFLTVAGVNPKPAANWAWLRPSFWRTDRTSITGRRSTLTIVTRTGTSSPLAHAIACFTLRMSLWPAAVCFSVGRFRLGFGISGSPFQVLRYGYRERLILAAPPNRYDTLSNHPVPKRNALGLWRLLGQSDVLSQATRRLPSSP